MKICLIRPSIVQKMLSMGNRPAHPLGLALIAGTLQKEGHQVYVIDGVGENPEQATDFMNVYSVIGLTNIEIAQRIQPDTQVIGLTCNFSNNWLNDRELIKVLKQAHPNCHIVAGGEHITAIPEFCLNDVPALDFCVLGEGELIMRELVHAIENRLPLQDVEGIAYRESDILKKNGRRERIRNLDEISRPAWELFPMENYSKYGVGSGVQRGNNLPILASRGCPYECTFCSSPQMWGTKYNLRTVNDVIDEMEYFGKKFGITNYDFYDLTAIINKRWIIDFCQELIARKLNYTWQLPSGTRSEAITEEVTALLYKSGCRNITYAPESGSPEILVQVKKKVNLGRMLTSIRAAYNDGLNIKMNIIIGLPGEKHIDALRTLWFMVRCSWVGVQDSTPSVFHPYPGSVLFNELLDQGKITLEDDSYFVGLLKADTIFETISFNPQMSTFWVRFYLFMAYAVFYSTNFLFRPYRVFTMSRNFLTQKFESRSEMALYELVRRKRQIKITTTTASVLKSTF